MHTATRLALPVIDRVRAINPAATICAYGLYAPLNEELLRAARRVDRAGAGGGSRSRRRSRQLQAPAAATAQASPPQRCRRSHSSSPIAPGCRHSIATRRCRCRTDRARSSARPMRRAAASIAAGIARSSRSTTASSASCPSTSCSPTSARRWSRAPRTSRSAIPISSTARRTRGASSKRCIASSRRSPTTRSSRSSTCSTHRELLPVLARHRLPVRHERGRVGRRRGAGEAREGPHARGFHRGGGARAATPGLTLVADLRRVHAVDDARRLHRSAERGRRARSGRRTSRRCSGASGCW